MDDYKRLDLLIKHNQRRHYGWTFKVLMILWWSYDDPMMIYADPMLILWWSYDDILWWSCDDPMMILWSIERFRTLQAKCQTDGLEDILARTCASEFWKELEQIERRLRIVKSLDASVSFRLRNLEMQKNRQKSDISGTLGPKHYIELKAFSMTFGDGTKCKTYFNALLF